MDYLQPILNNIKREQSTLNKFFGDLVVLNTPTIINHVKRRWLYGKSVDGGIIGTYASAEYRLFKMEINPLAGGNVDLFLYGDLSDNLQIKILSGNKFEIWSLDEKYQKIGKKYGFEEFGLTDEESHELLNDLKLFALESIFNNIYKKY
jgi:hypothetical protein